jgi:hypothetical protein
MDWSKPMFPEQKEITADEFEALIRQHNPERADHIIQLSKMSNGQYFLSPPNSSVDKRVFHQQVEDE